VSETVAVVRTMEQAATVMGNRYCPGCGVEIRRVKSRPSIFPTRSGRHELVCADEWECARRAVG